MKIIPIIPSVALGCVLVASAWGITTGVKPKQQPVVSSVSPRSERWTDQAAHLVPMTGNLEHKTITIDGRELKDCTMGDTTLVYEGTAPTVIHCKSASGLSISLTSHNPAMVQMMFLTRMVLQSSVPPAPAKPVKRTKH